MSAVLEAREPSAKYLSGLQPRLVQHFELLGTAPGGIAKLRELILAQAVRGKLAQQDPKDKPASELLEQIRAEKARKIAEGKIKRDKLPAPIAEEERPFSLPDSWEWVHLGATMDMINGKAFKPTDWKATGLPIVRIQNLNKIDAAFNYCDESLLSEKNKIDDGSFLISWSGTPGTSFGAFIWKRGPAALNQHIFKCELIGSAFDPEFLRLAINSQLNVLIAKAQGGVGLQHVTKGVLENLALVLPPLAEQARIVARVEELMRLCDALEAQGQLEAAQHAQLVQTLLGALTASTTPDELADNWQRVATHFDLLLDRPEAVDALEQTILQLAVRGLLVPQDPNDEPASVLLQKVRAEKDRLIAEGKIKRDKPLSPIGEEDEAFLLPHGWEWVRMGDLVNSSEAGWSPTCIGSPRRKGFWGVLKVSAVSWGTFDANANKELPAELSPRPEYEVRSGDFLLSRANTDELVARSVVVGEAEPQLMLSDKIIRLHVSSFVDREFLNLSNNSNHSRSHYAANASGTSSSMKNVSREVVLRTPVAMPPLTEQIRIVARVESLRRLCADLRQRLAARQTTQAHLAEALIDEVA